MLEDCKERVCLNYCLILPVSSVFKCFWFSGNGEPIQIYDGRRSHDDIKYEAAPISTCKSQTNEESSKGEIIYFRDSEDEMPDSDEDPDDDLDI